MTVLKPLANLCGRTRTGTNRTIAVSLPMRAVLLLAIIAATMFTGCGGRKAPEAEQAAPPKIVLQSITPAETDTRADVTIEGSAPIVTFTSFQLTEPLRLVVDISDADLGNFRDKIVVNKGPIIDITPSQIDNIVRLEIGLSQAVDTKVYAENGKLIAELAKPVETAKTEPEAVTPAAPAPAPEAPTEAAPAAPAPAAPEQGAEATAKVVKTVKAIAGKGQAKIVIAADGTMKPNSFMIEGKRLVIDIPGAKSKVRPSVIPVRKSGVDKVRVGQHGAPDRKVRIVLDLTKPMDYTITPEGNTLVVALAAAAAPKPQAAPAPKAEEPQERAAAQPQETPAAAEKEAAPAPVEAAPAPVEAPPAAPEPEKTPVAKAPTKVEEETAGVVNIRKFGGRRISLDLQDADLVNVLRLFGELANLNMILSPDVKGKVTVRLVNIPWDQALEIILKMNGLGYAIEDNILRIAPQAALAKEAEEELRTKEAKKKAEDLVTRIIPINYTEAGKILVTVKKSLSPRGDIVSDERTNTLIVKDIARNVEEVAELIRRLDRQTPQIMIEARIVEASLTFNRTIGVQWGGTAKATAATGNPTGFNFPSSVVVTGGPTMGATPSGTGNFIVNQPAPVGAQAGGGAIAFSFGSLSKALNLDLVLSAMESTGEGKVVSTPRVSALDNKEAKIEQGLSIPYSTKDKNGDPKIEFIDAKLSLVVTPHATPDNKIFMKIQATKNAPDNTVLGATGQPAIRKNEATTDILLSDGETAVIGGILVLSKTQTDSKVPFFGDLPLIGWLFKSRNTTEDKRELMIFITPRVVKQEVI